ncbi:DEAD/DEAH box helicase [Methylobacterium indicum]|uniref:DEAD/DEAH box helicase n=1 Tax=Methylobacterium indicum TaxID=1775910 RepID=A0ABR5H656_9HYPH|nr:DEAD/DEAH box helicase [Methylobacterium indicum]KMO19680.1 DEAD/DEAH box helicase [Methylobacterium indicum]KMO24415.1 DEAD/DEAH box helicase [Methylobacterium indicum]
MGLKAIFVGVDKYIDPLVPELNGARRDAIALWALFTDTVENLSAQLLVDETATHTDVAQSIQSALSAATEDDVVIISFAGHGSPDGNLILHDTVSSNLPGTALPMVGLAEQFATTKARVVLCILDCCFSGQAPARVLETSARPRSAFALTGIYGEGRILLAACATNEAAWEQPGSGHGLLTHAVIEAMSRAEGPSVSFPEIAGEVIRIARVEAERMGVTQTPVFLGNVQGGLTFPILQRGENFQAAFPVTAILQISGSFAELAQHGFPQEVVQQWVAAFPQGLNDLQLKAVNQHGVLSGNSLLVIAPTSSGKTMIGELSAVQAVIGGRKAAFLLPYRALVNEKFEEFSARYAEAGLRVVRCSGDAADGVTPVLSGRYDIAFFTYEMFLNLALRSPRFLNQLGLVVVDEGQFITDPNRGITVELIYALLLRARDRGVNPQLVVLSAVIGNLNSFDRWLGLPLLVAKERPVPLIEGVLDRRGTFQFVDTDGTTKSEALLPGHQIVQRREKPSSQDVIVPLARQLVQAGEKLIVFRNMRGPAQGCARYLSKELGLPPASSVLDALPTQDLTAASQDLRGCLAGGTAFHNTNLLRAEREAIERGFRSTDAGIHVLAATTTLAAGINSPASTVILAENEFVGEDGRPFTVAEYKNMAGRAGRFGYNEIGKSIILADTPMERAQLFKKYVLGAPEAVTSSFQHRDLPTWVLRLLSQVRGVLITDIPGLLVNTFGGYTASRANPQWISRVEGEISALVERLLQAGLAEREGELIHLTLVGRACGASSLSFESSIRLVELMRQVDISGIQPFQVVAMIQVLDEMDAIYTPVMKKGRSESVRAADVAQRYGHPLAQSLQRYCRDEVGFWGRCKRASLMYDWMSGEPIDILEKRYTTTPFQGAISYGDIIRIADGTRFHLRSAHQILSALFPDQPEFLSGLDEILRRLEFGLPDGAVSLVRLPVALTRGQYLALFSAGCTTIESVRDLGMEVLVALVGKEPARDIASIRSSMDVSRQQS